MDKEEESKRSFKEAQRQKNVVEDKLNNLKESYTKHKVSNINDSVVMQKVKMNYLNALNYSINRTTIELDEKNSFLDIKREELKIKQIERKTVEILKEKQSQAFQLEQNFIEQKNNDEFALYGYIRNREGR
jgi:flagellar FliJ protein